MRSVCVVLCVVLAAVCALATLPESYVVDEALVHLINSNSSLPWRATLHPMFAKMTVEEAKRWLRAQPPTALQWGKELAAKHDAAAADVSRENLTETFDARQQWNGCVGAIRNQGQCGSCWAFGATETFADRICIASGGSVQVVLSPEELISCDGADHGCNGGNPLTAWQWMSMYGVVSDSCVPYVGYVEGCGSSCVDGEPWKPYYVNGGTIGVWTNEAAIMQEIQARGPVEAAFYVYQDFMSYSGGVYVHTSGQLLGGHAVKMLGWGTEGGLNYWLCANSWGPGWGEQGFFKIQRGVNMCGIESNGAVAGWPR